MGWRGLWRGRRRNISARNAAVLSPFMTGNAVSARKRFSGWKVLSLNGLWQKEVGMDRIISCWGRYVGSVGIIRKTVRGVRKSGGGCFDWIIRGKRYAGFMNVV